MKLLARKIPCGGEVKGCTLFQKRGLLPPRRELSRFRVTVEMR
jgi:hypothetical protein